MANDRTKVGKGNRAIVRKHFRAWGIELPFGRNCRHNRYSFKPGWGITHSSNPTLDQKKLYEQLLNAAFLCPIKCNIVKTKSVDGYHNTSYNVAIRFSDV